MENDSLRLTPADSPAFWLAGLGHAVHLVDPVPLLVSTWQGGGEATAFDEEAWAQELVVATADSREGMTAFAERRDPEFKGW